MNLTRAWPALILTLVSFTGAAGEAAKDDEAFIKSLTLAPGLEAHLWAGEKQVVNPVAICFDEKNRLYVAQTMRFRIGGGIDIRAPMFMYFDDYKCQTLADRVANIEKYKEKFKPEYFTKYSESVALLEDDGAGRCGKITTVADGFNHPLDGPAAGIVTRNGAVYLCCIPSVWKLSEADGDGVFKKREKFFEGFGVRFGISGHDLHGVVFGPDGKLYWTMGDRGYNVKTMEGSELKHTASGGVFRCNPDGSDLEIYYYNLRNPQELAFDEFGNAFSCDNNADIGDTSRLVYVIEGGDSGWTAGWQTLSYGNFAEAGGLGGRKPNPWLLEGIYKMRFDEQPCHITPPVGHITSGPCGLAAYPGTGLPDSYARSFFVCDYTAGTNSGVHSFKVEEDGAGFKMVEPKKFVWGLGATDVAFSYDGQIFVSDYIGGWHQDERKKGRIVAVQHKEAGKLLVATDIKKLFADGFSKTPAANLANLLKHPDMRVRTAAQFELASRGEVATLRTAATSGNEIHARLHGIWGLGQFAKQNAEVLKTFTELLSDKEAYVREAAVKMIGDARAAAASEKLLPLLRDSSPRVRTFAAITAGKIKLKSAVTALIQILKDNDDKDAYLRHGAVVGLAGAADVATLEPFAKDASKAVRLGVLLAYRKLNAPQIAAFLNDSDPLIYAEAIRAIHDVPIMGAMPQLAAELKRHFVSATAPGKMTQLLYHRLIDANYRYGTAENAQILAEFAAKSDAGEDLRIHALAQLEKWEQPTDLDPIVGLYRPVGKRDKAAIREVLKESLQSLLSNSKDKLLAKAANMAAGMGLGIPEHLLIASLDNAQSAEELRLEAIRHLLEKNPAKLKELAPKLIADANLNVRSAALDAFIQLDPGAGIAAANEILTGKVKTTAGTRVITDKNEKEWKNLKMGPPSKDDYADRNSKNGAVFTWVKGFAQPHKDAGANGQEIPRLNDGLAGENNDDINRNSWFDHGESRFLLDLKKPIDVARVNVYSWHRENRAPQRFSLWGTPSETPDPAAKDLSSGWTKIATVDTEPLKNGGQHGSTIFSSDSTLGKFRYLLFLNANRNNLGTFYSEIDVYEKGQVLPPLDGDGDVATVRAKQAALLALGRAKDARAAAVLLTWMEQMIAGKVEPALQMDLLDAAALRGEDDVKAKLAKYQESVPRDEALPKYSIALQGGDAAKGSDIFEFHGAQCMRCHRIGTGKGGDAGPNLQGVGKRLTRDKILESLIEPNAVVVAGFGMGVFRMNDGTIVTGSVLGENEKEITLKLPDEKVKTIQVSEVKKRLPAVSPMPSMEGVLKPRDIRDLIAFLSTQ